MNLQYTDSTLEDIRAAFDTPDNPAARVLLNAITRSTSALYSTPTYYISIKRNLEAYYRFNSYPNFFFIFSTADL